MLGQGGSLGASPSPVHACERATTHPCSCFPAPCIHAPQGAEATSMLRALLPGHKQERWKGLLDADGGTGPGLNRPTSKCHVHRAGAWPARCTRCKKHPELRTEFVFPVANNASMPLQSQAHRSLSQKISHKSSPWRRVATGHASGHWRSCSSASQCLPLSQSTCMASRDLRVQTQNHTQDSCKQGLQQEACV